MIVREWIDLIKDVLAGGDYPQEIKGKHHPEIIRRHLAIVHNYLIGKVAYPEAVRSGDLGFLDVYAKTFMGIAIQEDSQRDEKFCELPTSYLPLPMNRGIRIVSPEQSQHEPFLYRNNNTSRIFSNLDVSTAYSEGRYYIEGDKLYFSSVPYGVIKLLIKMIVPFDKLDDLDEVVFPSGYGKIVSDMVIQSLMGKPPQKFVNDNNSETR